MNTGDVLGGHFEILEKLGSGGMGEVWKARDTRLNRIVAIKTLKNHTERFEREARAIAALNHPHICGIHDVGPDYLVMEFIQGAPPRRPLPVNEVLRLGAQVAGALAAAHAAGITHRDLKPDNILITNDGRAKVLDFGLAKLADAAPSQDEATRTMALTDEGTIVGTAAYMSPEQAEGKKTDHRSDIFSLGTVLYELITGKRAFEGDSKMSTLAAVLREEPKPISILMPDIPVEVAKLIAKMMRKDPERRVQSMADVKLTLEDLRDESSSGSAPAAVAPAPRKRWPLVAALAFLAVVGTGLTLWMKRAPAIAPAPKLSQLTSFSGIELDPALSPDGRQLAFVWDGDQDGGPLSIYVKLVDAGSPVRLTHNPEGDRRPVWSPEGNYIAFRRGGVDGGIYVIPALGGREKKVVGVEPPKTVVSLDRGLDWSADGKYLLYSDPSVEPSVLRWVSFTGDQQGQFASPPADFVGDTAPSFSPDGTSVAFLRLKSFQLSSLMVGSLKGLAVSGERLLPGAAFRSLVWMPDSQSLVVGTVGGFLEWVPANGGPSRRIETVGPNAQSPSMARRAPRLAFTRTFIDSNIWRLDLQAPKPIPSRFIASSLVDLGSDLASRDGRVVFTSERSGNLEVWIANPDGTNPEQLTTDAVRPAAARLSPDGKWVVFAARPNNNVDLYLQESRGGALRRLTTEPGDDHSARFSRDGHWIYFCSDRGGKRDIWKIPLGSGPAQQVTKNGGWVSRESLDGQWVFYSKDGSAGLFRMPVGGGTEEVVVPRSSYSQWDVGEKGIYFVDQKEIRFFRFSDRQTIPVLPVPLISTNSTGLSLSTDGRFLSYTQNDSRVSDIMLLDNFHGY